VDGTDERDLILFFQTSSDASYAMVDFKVTIGEDIPLFN